MSRKLRLEYEGALYHVINRGNYRGAIFATQGAKDAFMKCLEEACGKAKWMVHGYVLMSNHYHLALETPKGNLVEGMRWLQSTFANRYNRFRKENGHVFQGRYKAILVEDREGLGAVCHYLHLNPVRARVRKIEQLGSYQDSSYWHVLNPHKRPSWLDVKSCLAAAGELTDTAAGRRKYVEYLGWLAEDEPAQQQMKFKEMSKGWALGSRAFKKALVEDHKKLLLTAPVERVTLETRELVWQNALEKALRSLRKTAREIQSDRKSARWKVAIACHLKSISTVTNVWLAENLHMGIPSGVSRYVAQMRRGVIDGRDELRKIAKITV